MPPKFQPSPHLPANWPTRPRTRFPSGFFLWSSLCIYFTGKLQAVVCGTYKCSKTALIFFVTEFYGDPDDLPGSRELEWYYVVQRPTSCTFRDRQIKLFRLSGAQNPPKSLTVRKWTVLEAQEELGRVLGHSWDPEARSDRIWEKKSSPTSRLRKKVNNSQVNNSEVNNSLEPDSQNYKKTVH